MNRGNEDFTNMIAELKPLPNSGFFVYFTEGSLRL